MSGPEQLDDLHITGRIVKQRDAALAERDSLTERVAELVTEGNELFADFLFEHKQVIELRQVLTEMFTCLNTADMSLLDADQVDEWRERAGLADADPPAAVTAGTEHLADELQKAEATIADYRDALCAMQAERDKLQREPAVVTAGTEHLAEKIRGLAIPDEES